MLSIFKKAGKGRYHDLVSLSKIFNAVLVCPNELVLNDLYDSADHLDISIEKPVIIQSVEDLDNIPKDRKLIITDINKFPVHYNVLNNVLAISKQMPADYNGDQYEDVCCN